MSPDISERATSTDLVRRSCELDDFELRTDDDTGELIFEGVASVVDHPYPVRDRWGTYEETITTGAFDKTISESKRVSLYVNHNSDRLLANRAGGTLEVFADPNLRVVARLDPDNPDTKGAVSNIRRGELREMSIGFVPVKARDEWNDDYTAVQRHEVILRETSIVEAGANTGGTSAKLRAFDDFMATITDVDMDPDELQRAIRYLTDRLGAEPPLEPVEVVDAFAERDRLDRERLARKRHAPA